MKQMIKIIRKVDVERQYVQILKLEVDYELASLHDAVQRKNEKDIKKSKQRLSEIVRELEGFSSRL